MKTEAKVEKSTTPAVGNSNRFCRYGGDKTKKRQNYEVETVELDGVCFYCSDGNHANIYSQGMRKVAEYFSRTATCGTDIQSAIMEATSNIIT